jgi:hypothetical protein
MKKTVLSLVATATLFSNDVNPELTTFRAGDRVNVGDVNGNFESLKQGILDLQTKYDLVVQGLETKITTLETENQNLKTELSEPRKIFYKTGHQKDGRDEGYIDLRVLNISKENSDTALRITYTDNLAVATSDGSCQWELRVFDINRPTVNQCPDLIFFLYDRSSDGATQSNHIVSTLSGVCENLPVGNYIVKAYITNEFTDLEGTDYSGANCFTGWGTQFLLQAEEIYKAEVE